MRFRIKHGILEKAFVVLVIFANYDSNFERKATDVAILAFKELWTMYPQAFLYMHTAIT